MSTEMKIAMSVVNERLEGECVMSLEESEGGTKVCVALEDKDGFDLVNCAIIEPDYFEGKSAYEISDIICGEVYPTIMMSRREELLRKVRYGAFPSSGFSKVIDRYEAGIAPEQRRIRKMAGDIVFFYWVPSSLTLSKEDDYENRTRAVRNMFDHNRSLSYEDLENYGISIKELDESASRNVRDFGMEYRSDGEHKFGIVRSEEWQGLSVLCLDEMLEVIMEFMKVGKIYLIPTNENEIAVFTEDDYEKYLKEDWTELIDEDFREDLHSLYRYDKNGLNLVEGAEV